MPDALHRMAEEYAQAWVSQGPRAALKLYRDHASVTPLSFSDKRKLARAFVSLVRQEARAA